MRLRRSLLYVPGNMPGMLQNIPVFEADVNRLGLNLRPIFNLNSSIGGEQAIAFGSATSSSLQFVLRPDIYRAMVGHIMN